MRFVYQQITAEPPFDVDDFNQRSNVAQHAVNAFDDDDRVSGPFAKAHHATFQIFGIVVAEANDFSAAQGAGIINTGVAVRVDQHDRAGGGQSTDDRQVRGIAGGKDDGGGAIKERHQLLLQLQVRAIAAVRHA
ncbi:hypothetical protein D3C78_1563090 [compost metagenome]